MQPRNLSTYSRYAALQRASMTDALVGPPSLLLLLHDPGHLFPQGQRTLIKGGLKHACHATCSLTESKPSTYLQQLNRRVHYHARRKKRVTSEPSQDGFVATRHSLIKVHACFFMEIQCCLEPISGRGQDDVPGLSFFSWHSALIDFGNILLR